MREAKTKTQSGQRNCFFFLHLCKSPDACTGACAPVCVCDSVCMYVCLGVLRVCEFCFPSATTSSDNDNDNACTAIRDLLQLTLCFLSTKTHLFTYYYYFCFLAKILQARQRQHTRLLFVYTNCIYINAFVHANKIINN